MNSLRGVYYCCASAFFWSFSVKSVLAQKWPKDQCMGLYDCPSQKKDSSKGIQSSRKKSSSGGNRADPVDSKPENFASHADVVLFDLKLGVDLFGPYTYETFDYSSLRDEQKYAPLLRTSFVSVGSSFSNSFLSHGPDFVFRFAETFENNILRYSFDNSLDYRELIKVSGYSFGLAYRVRLPSMNLRFWDPQVSVAIERPVVEVRSQRFYENTEQNSLPSDDQVKVAGTLGYLRMSSGWWFEWKAFDSGMGCHAYVPFVMNLIHDSENAAEEELKNRLRLRHSPGFGLWIGTSW